MKTKIIVRSFTVYDFLPNKTVDEQIDEGVNKYEGRLVSVLEHRYIGGYIHVRIYLEVPDNTEESKS